MAAGRVAPAGLITRTALLLGLASLAYGCTPTTDLASESVAAHARVGATQGSSVAITQDERIAVVSNRTDGVVSIVHLDPSKSLSDLVSKAPHTDIPFHPLNASKPWAAVIGADDDTAFVLVRGLRQVVKVSGLHGSSPRVSGTLDVGSEPTSIVISPSGKSLYVANWAEGTVSNISITAWVEARWDLNRRLSDAALLGPLVGDGVPASAVWNNADLERHRPGLAHPRALAITDDGDADDADEILYATEFFAQPLPNDGHADPDAVDHSRKGLVYPIVVGVGAGHAPPGLNVISLSAVDVGIADSEGNPTGCFPNQLYSAAASGDRLYVTSVCASPSGPVEAGPTGSAATANFKTLLHSAVFVVDTTKNEELPSEHLVLTKTLQDAYDSDVQAGADPVPNEQRMPLIPSEIVVSQPNRAGDRQAYLSAFGSGAIFPIGFRANGSAAVGVEGRRFIDLGTATPAGLVTLSNDRALVADDLGHGLRVLDLSAQQQVASKDVLARDWSTDAETQASEVVSDEARSGRRLFSTGLKSWSFQGQAWSSCESCHPEGLSDGVTWRFTRGPRRTISLAGTYYRDEPTRRLLLWGANVDEVHDFEAIARQLSGGVGGVVWNPYSADSPGKDCRLLYDGKMSPPDHNSESCPAPLATTERNNGLNGSLSKLGRVSQRDEFCTATAVSCNVNASFDWRDIDAFMRSVRAPHAPTTLDPDRVSRGEALFQKLRCNGCHAGSGWTLSHVFYDPGPMANGQMSFADPRLSTPPASFDDAQLNAMLGQLRTQRYVIPDTAPSAFRPASGVVDAPFRVAPASDASADTKLDFVFGPVTPPVVMPPPPAPPADQIKCVLRAVGTFPSQSSGENQAGVVPLNGDAPPVHEVRRVLNAAATGYDDKLAFGDTGFNIPSLVGVSLGGPFFHAGNARTLEESFDPVFGGHYAAFGAGAPSSDDIQNLVSYLLSIDEDEDDDDLSQPLEPAAVGFDPDLCAQFRAP